MSFLIHSKNSRHKINTCDTVCFFNKVLSEASKNNHKIFTFDYISVYQLINKKLCCCRGTV